MQSTEITPYPVANELVTPQGAPPASTATASRFLHAFGKRWLIAILLAIPLTVLVAGLTWRFVPKTYTTKAVLRVSPAVKTLIFETADSRKDGATFELYKKTQRQLLRSRYVITPALRDLAVAKIPALQDELDPVAWVEQNLTVAFPDDAEIMTVALTWQKPEGLHEIVNRVVKAYMDQVVYVEKTRRNARLNDLVVAREKFDQELRNKRALYKQAVERMGSPDASGMTFDQINATQKHTAIRQRLQKLRFDIMEHELYQSEGARGQSNSDEIEKQLTQSLTTDPEMLQLQSGRDRTMGIIRSLKQVLNEDRAAPKIAELNERLAAIDKKIEARQQSLREELVTFEQQIVVAGKKNLSILKSQEAQLEDELKKTEAEVRGPRSGPDAEMLRLDMVGIQEVLSHLSAEIERTKVELTPGANSDAERVKELSAALPAVVTGADAKSRITKAAGAGIATFLAIILGILWLEVRKGNIVSGEEVESSLGMTVIGTVPMIPGRVMRRIGHKSDKHRAWKTRLSESVDAIAATLLHGKVADQARVIMVSSATSGEGKSTIAANLATSMAKAGYRTVLVDFDLRQPKLHRVFGLQLEPGVSDLLQDPDCYGLVLQETEFANLTFISAGWNDTKGLSSLSKPEMHLVFERLRADFDFVVVDGSPVLPVVDTRLIAQHTDGVVISVLRGSSRLPLVQRACELLDAFDIPICGVVMTGVAGDTYPNSYHTSRSLAEVR